MVVLIVLGGIFDITGKEAEAAKLAELTLASNFWEDTENAQSVLKERSSLLESVNPWKQQNQALADATLFLELAEDGEQEAIDELQKILSALERDIGQVEFQSMLGG